jgi:hypothetical protein
MARKMGAESLDEIKIQHSSEFVLFPDFSVSL